MASRLGIGAGIGIPFRNIASGGGKPYLSPEVKEALKAVVIAYGKTNNDSDRAVVKNLVDASNPFIISNAAYKLNSGYGGYVEDYSGWTGFDTVTVNTDRSKFTVKVAPANLYYLRASIGRDIESFKIKITNFTEGRFFYNYVNSEGREQEIYFTPESIQSNNVVILPKSWNTLENASGYTEGFFFEKSCNIGITIEQLPLYQGAFVTDGVDDLITSTKTVQEMLGGSNEITVVSMIHQIELNSTHSKGFTNYIETIDSSTSYVGTQSNVAGKTGIYGYTYNNATQLLINNILGDKNDYEKSLANATNILSNSRFSVAGRINNTNTSSSVAWYWTIIANKVLTTDQINQVIAYYNLDRCVEPTVLYDVKRQGLSNDTPDSDWYLKDFSKNGFDMSLFNFAKKLDSGIGKYGMDFLEWKSNSGMNFTSTKLTSTKPNLSGGWLTFRNVSGLIPETKVKVSGAPREFVFIGNNNGTDDKFSVTINNGVYTIPEFTLSSASGFYINNNSGDWSNLVIEQIPSHAGALCFDGVEDYGKVTGLPIYKDYTVVADYERFNIGNIEGIGTPPVLSKSYTAGQGSFIMNFIASTGNSIHSYSFGAENISNFSDLARQIFYQSKYKSQGFDITAGTGIDGDSLWLGTARDNDSRFFNGAIYSLMTFPYSMSEFLIERQLKKHKLGTLYPDMVEFRPVIKSNVELATKLTFVIRGTSTLLNAGDYIPKDSELWVIVTMNNLVDELTKFSINGKEITIPSSAYNPSTGKYGFPFVIDDKSPQKIDITIDEYIRYEDIVQPYPAIVTLKQDGKDITWGDKLKVGDEVTFVTHTNLLPNLYTVSGAMYYNGKFMYGNTPITVAKSMTFTTVHNYIKSNEPKCILSPSRLRIPNSSYKILGYIPDISGHGNHGKINNSAYAGMSGANGYVENFTTWGVYNGAILTDNTIKTNSNFNPVNSWVAYKGANTILNSFSVNITGIPEGGILNFRVNADTFIELSNGRNDLSFDNIPVTVSSGFRITKASNLDWSNLVIQQIGQYEGAYCLDGVDDFITIPTTVGGKQVLMKVNWQSSIGQGMLYDQRGTAFAIWNSDKYNDDETDTIPAYSARNGGNTYIDGILNKNILASQLRNITHNIVATNTMLNGSSVSPTIGCRTEHDACFTNMSLYDFMLFDEISTDEEILTLNEYVGIEGNTDDLFN